RRRRMMNRKVLWLCHLMLPLWIGWPGLQAEADVLDFLRGFTATGEAEVPVVGVAKNRNSSKYEEYRHIPEEQPSLDELKVDLENKEKKYYLELRTEDSLQRDQRYVLRLGKYGQYEMELGWDELP